MPPGGAAGAARGPRGALRGALRGIAVAGAVSCAWAGGGARRLSAVCSGPAKPGSCRLEEGWAAGSAAWGDFDDTVGALGFASLRVFGREGLDPRLVSFAAGAVEGALTAQRTAQHLSTSLAAEFEGAPELWKKAEDFLLENDAYVLAQIRDRAPTSPYWEQVALIYAQLDGLLEGHRLAVAGGTPAAPMNRTGLL